MSYIEQAYSYSQSEFSELISKLDDAYYNSGIPLVSDNEYDNLRNIYIERFGPLKKVGAIVKSKQKVELPYWLGSMDKIKADDQKEFGRWINKFPGPYILTSKLDGVSALLIFKNKQLKMYSRGDGKEGFDISELIPYINIPKISSQRELAVRGELIMSKEKFEKHKNLFANARNLVSGLVNCKTVSKREHILKDVDFVVYEIIQPSKVLVEKQMDTLEKLGFQVVNYKKFPFMNLTNLQNELDLFKLDSDYEMDGLVVYDDSQVRGIKTSGNPKYAFAFKMLSETAITEVEYVEWNATKHGVLKPRIKVKETQLCGVMINYTTGFNAKYIFDNKIGPKTKVEITRSGDVIPYIVNVIQPTSPQLPENDGWEWNETKVDITLKDKEVEGVQVQQLLNFVTKLKIKQVSDKTLEKLYNAGYDTIQKLVRLKPSQVAQIDGFKERSATIVCDNIQKGIQSPELNVLMASTPYFGFGIGERKIKLITNEIPTILDEKEDTLIRRIPKIKGFTETSAKQFILGLIEFKKFLKTVPEIKFKLPNNKVNKNGKFSEEKIVFTGFRNKEWEKIIEEQGGQVTSTVTGNTTILVTKDPTSGSSKITKARENGTKVMSIEEFQELLN